ncbi:MAG TPA: nucleotidyltransferase domain-containing protein [Leptospiraceae bacterium]|nr:nucleotidyltransferase domain-containing protein [Leptospiraceae bacterium]
MPENFLDLSFVKEKLLSLKPELIEKYKIKRIGLFGSFANGTFHDKSDIDILVEFRPSNKFKI